MLNPACARLRDGTLQLYPRMVAPGNVSRIGSFRARERADGTIEAEQCGYALEPQEPYEIRDGPLGYGCEDPRVTYVPAIDAYLMAYVAFGHCGPQVAAAISHDGLRWERLGVLRFAGRERSCADKDAAFFPEPVLSPNGTRAIAFYHRPSLPFLETPSRDPVAELEAIPPRDREGIAIGYVSLDALRSDPRNVCDVRETHRLSLPAASWGRLKTGCGTPPLRVREGWLSIVHGVDSIGTAAQPRLQYSAGLLLHDAQRIDRVLFRSPAPVIVPEVPGELQGTVADVVFPTGIDPRAEGTFDVYYGMADDLVGRGRLTLERAAVGGRR